MHKPEFILENKTHRIVWDSEIQMDHQILARRPDLVLINKKKRETCHLVGFAVPVEHREKAKRETNT